MQQCPHEWPIRIYYEDTDMQGIVYYANYLKYLERARTEFLRQRGVEQDALIENHQLAFAVRTVQMEYLKSAKFNDQLIVQTRVETFKSASLIFHQSIIRNDPNHEIINTANIKVACLDADTMRVKVIPKTLIERLL